MQNDHIENDIEIRSVEIPPKVIEDYHLEKGDELQLHLDGASITITFNKDIDKSDTIPLKNFLVPAFITTLLFFLYFLYIQKRYIPLIGDDSIAGFVLTLGMLSGMIGFTNLFIKAKKQNVPNSFRLISYRTFPTIVLAFGVILFMSLLLLFQFVGDVFLGVNFDIWTAAIINFVFVSLINYVMNLLANKISTRLVMNTLAITIIGGSLTAMATNKDLQWWQYNLSFLGTQEAISSWNFNITLIFSALLMIALIDFLFVNLSLKFEKTKKLGFLRLLLVLTALSLGGVGLFPHNDNVFFQYLHNRSALNLVYLILILIVSVRWLLPQISKHFIQLSYIICASLIVCIFLFQGVGYLSLTAFEILAFALAFAWLFVLFQEMERLVYDTGSSYTVKIK